MIKSHLLRTHDLLAYEPTPEQLRLYDAAPHARGFASCTNVTPAQEMQLFDAVLVVALTQAWYEDDQKPPEVYLFVPPKHESWAIEQIRRVATGIFARCKHLKMVHLARHVGPMFKALLIGGQIAPDMARPERWASFGFEPDDSLPKWLTDAQLPVYAFLRDDEP